MFLNSNGLRNFIFIYCIVIAVFSPLLGTVEKSQCFQETQCKQPQLHQSGHGFSISKLGFSMK